MRRPGTARQTHNWGWHPWWKHTNMQTQAGPRSSAPRTPRSVGRASTNKGASSGRKMASAPTQRWGVASSAKHERLRADWWAEEVRRLSPAVTMSAVSIIAWWAALTMRRQYQRLLLWNAGLNTPLRITALRRWNVDLKKIQDYTSVK